MIVFCTTEDKKTAKFIANTLVEKGLAACVSLNKIKSIYFWNGQICKEKEWQLIIKSSEQNFKDIESEILSVHSYDTPEIFALKFEHINEKYNKWIEDSTNKEKI